jgi:hypothetical protein
VIRRQEQQVERLMEEFDETDVTALVQAANSPRHAFGSPPRTVTPDVRRHLFFSGELVVIMICYLFLLAFGTIVFGCILWGTDPSEIQDTLLPAGGLASIVIVYLAACYLLHKKIINRNVRLLETATVVKCRIRRRANHRKVMKTTLMPIGGEGEPFEMPIQYGLNGETVHVFYNEAKPKDSFIAETFPGGIWFDRETGEIDCDPNPRARYAKWALLVLALGIGVVVSRLIWVW